MEYNPGFILQEGDLMVYDGGITCYYRGDEFLYSKDYYGKEVFGPDYVRHIPGLDERAAEALENMIYDVVLADHSLR